MNDESVRQPSADDGHKLTAYALGERDEALRAEVAARLDASPEARQTVGEIGRCGELVRQAHGREPCPAASIELRQAVRGRLDELELAATEPLADRTPRRRRAWLPLSLAASLLAVAAGLYWAGRAAHETTLALSTDAGKPAGEVLKAEQHRRLPQMELQGSQGVLVTDDIRLAGRRSPAAQQKQMQRMGGKDELSAEYAGRHIQGHRLEAYIPPASVEPQHVGGGIPADTGTNYVGSLGAGGMPGGMPGGAMQPGMSGAGGMRAGGMGGGGGGTGGGGYVGPLGGMEGRGMPGADMLDADGKMPPGMDSSLSLDESRENLYTVLAPKFETKTLGSAGDFNTEAYDSIVENPFLKVADHPLSTFSIDVDTASYANVRRFLNSAALPPPGAVRIEELVNYFSYDYPQPEGDAPFSVHAEVAQCPWRGEHRLLKVGLQGRQIDPENRPASNLVFLLDVSGSMADYNKLPLVKESMNLLVDKLTENDRVAIVVYAGASGLVLPSTTGDNKATIRAALGQLEAGGSTNGGAGLELAYDVAAANLIRGGTNRVILATDGDFNVGVTSDDELVRRIEERAASGVFFSALGFGMGNLKDSKLEKLADKGNGNYAYIDTLAEARKVLVEQMSGTLVTIAKDVKIQIEFNPAQVAAFRLIGYENRILRHEDFNNDQKDAGEVGAGHTVTALYEIRPAGKEAELPARLPEVDRLKYQERSQLTEAAGRNELLTLKLRYKEPDARESKLWEYPVTDSRKRYGDATADFQFAAAVAAFGMILGGSEHRGNATFDAVLELAAPCVGPDPHGYRAEFVELVKQAKALSHARHPTSSD